MNILFSFFFAVEASIVAYYICKWLVQRLNHNFNYSTAYVAICCVVVSRRSHRYASFLRLAYDGISSTIS